MLNVLDRVIGAISTMLGWLAAACLAVTAGATIIEVIMRFGFSSPTSWGIEIATYSISLAASLGAAYTLRANSHLEIDFVTSRLSGTIRNRLAILTDIVSFIFCVFIAWFGTQSVHIAWIIGAVSVSELRVPLWIPQLCIPIGFAALALEFLARILVRTGMVTRRNATGADGSAAV